MAEQGCVWCGRSKHEVKRLFPGPVIFICSSCIEQLSSLAGGEECVPSEKAREEIDLAVVEGFEKIVKQLNFGPLQDTYVRLMKVKFKEEPGSPTFQEVFNEFKKGVEAELANDDYQTRYDLAIAYHEMGLSEDAFREMLNSMRGALRQKDYDRAGEIMSALLYFHDDSESVIKGIFRTISETGAE